MTAPLPSKFTDLPEGMFIQIIICPHCGNETRVSVPPKPKSSSETSLGTPCHCGNKIYMVRKQDGSYKINTSCCFVVTETFYERSRMRFLHRRCKSAFRDHPFLADAFVFYQNEGRRLAKWARKNLVTRFIVRFLFAIPIVCAASRNRIFAFPFALYLFFVYRIAQYCIGKPSLETAT